MKNGSSSDGANGHAAKSARPFEVVVWGASGFTGRLVAEHLASLGTDLRWAVAGRDRAKLEGVLRAITAKTGATVPILIGDASDPASLDAIAAQTAVICSTVGPFARYGEPVVAACVRNRTDYCDITGEPNFIRNIIDTHHAAAVERGVRIVPTCGFDSIPSDLGVFVLSEHAHAQYTRGLTDVRAYVTAAKGGMSGGTVASMLQILDTAASDRSLRRMLADPYSLSPDRSQDPASGERDRLSPRFDADADGWSAPWMMGAINSRVVRRSNALFGYKYGRELRYEEALLMRGRIKGGVMAAAIAAGTAASVAVLASSSVVRRWAATKLPASGEGPSATKREAGYFALKIFAMLEGDEPVSAGGRARLLARVSGSGDPGYNATSRMLGQSALCLARDPKQPGMEGGILTPATAMGSALVSRLQQHGFTFEVTSL